MKEKADSVKATKSKEEKGEKALPSSCKRSSRAAVRNLQSMDIKAQVVRYEPKSSLRPLTGLHEYWAKGTERK